MPLIKRLGSLTFTVIICVFTIGLLTVSTTMESKLGTDAAQKMFYQTRWFDFVLSLFLVNIFCSTILRWPFQKSHIGFIITHIGILALLIGAMMTRISGVEGQMMLFEGETSQSITTGGFHLSVKPPDETKIIVPVSGGNQPLPLKSPDVKARIGRVIEHAAEKENISDGGPDAVVNHAVHLQLESPMMDMAQEFWLSEQSPINPQPDVKILWPAHILLKPGEEPAAGVEKPTLIIKDADGRELLVHFIEGHQADPMALGDSGLSIENFFYYPNAAVVGKELTDGPEGTPYNPAVEFDITDGKGGVQHVIKFAFFPEFESMHPSASAVSFPVSTVFEAPGQREDTSGISSLTIYYWPGGRWTYTVSSKTGETSSGDLAPGVKISLTWADMTFETLEILDRAQATTQMTQSQNGKGPMVLELIVEYQGQEHKEWLVESQNVRFTTPAGDYRFTVSDNTREVPFALTLKDFRKVDYPGTTAAASYESDVTLEDSAENLSLTRTISMNEPLDYKGYRIFQSSFIENNERGEASIFTVAKNPGIPLIYGGSIIIFIGAGWLFYGPKNGLKKR